MRKSAFSDFKTALALESLLALARLRKTGEAPTDVTAPRLMAIWRGARDKLTGVAMNRAVSVYTFKGLRFQVSAIYDRAGQLHRFYLRDYFTGALLLTGDNAGPIFCPDSRDAIEAPSLHSSTVPSDLGTHPSQRKANGNAAIR